MAAAGNESQNTLHLGEAMHDRQLEPLRNICDEKGIRLSTTVPYHPSVQQWTSAGSTILASVGRGI